MIQKICQGGWGRGVGVGTKRASLNSCSFPFFGGGGGGGRHHLFMLASTGELKGGTSSPIPKRSPAIASIPRLRLNLR